MFNSEITTLKFTKTNHSMDILIDFDGTCVTHAFPEVGLEIGAVPVLKELVEKGHRLILFTMRGNMKGTQSPEQDIIVKDGGLKDAIGWFESHDIPLYGIQTNPGQHTWTDSPKAYGQLLIDDIALGIPLLVNSHVSSRPYVDWQGVYFLLKSQGIL